MHDLKQNARSFPERALFIGTEPWVYGKLLNHRRAPKGELFPRALRPTFHLPHMCSRSISDNAVQPGGELGATLKLAQVLKRQEKSLLQSIFAILRIAQQPSHGPLKSRHARREKMIQFQITHIHRQGLAFLQFRDRTAAAFVAQVIPLSALCVRTNGRKIWDCKCDSIAELPATAGDAGLVQFTIV